MPVYSKADLAARALRQPGLYAPDETISAADQADAEEMCESLVDTLVEMGVALPNGSVHTVPAAWLVPLANFIGLYLMESYGGPAPTRDQVVGAMIPLHRMSSRKTTGVVLQADYF